MAAYTREEEPRSVVDRGGTPSYTWNQVQKHTTTDSLWVIIHDKVYDVTEFQKSHPGSAKPFLYYAGKDATAGFEKITKHAINEDIGQYMANMCIGTIRHC